MRTAEGDARAVAMQIAHYLREHPDAADTLEGAARWWMTPQRTVDVMERAMTMLEDANVVERHALPGGAVVFRAGRGLASFDDFSATDSRH